MTENISIPNDVTKELAEEVGRHIGDGSMNFYKNYGKLRGIYQLRGHIEDDKEHYVIRIKPFFKLLYDIDLSLRDMPSTRVFGFQIWNDKLVDFKQKLGLPLGKKFSISIPNVFLENDDLKIAVIRGIFDTDGGIYLEKKNNKLYPRIEITTISSNLAEQMQKNLIALGLRTTVYSWLSNLDFNRQRAYKINIRGKEMLDIFFNIIKPANPKHIRKYIRFKECGTDITYKSKLNYAKPF
ncbi:MAG: LAGLIDADG family homing endonuclease, partial [Nanoarchaeota archaeon]